MLVLAGLAASHCLPPLPPPPPKWRQLWLCFAGGEAGPLKPGPLALAALLPTENVLWSSLKPIVLSKSQRGTQFHLNGTAGT